MLHIPSRLALVALIVAGLVVGGPRVASVEAQQAFVVDPRGLALTEADLSADYWIDPTQSVYTELPGGGGLTIAVLRRPVDGTGPYMVRNTVSSLPDQASALQYYDRLPAVLSQQGFVPAAASPLMPESASYSSVDQLEGRPVLYQTLIYRLENMVVVTTLVGPPAFSTGPQVLRMAWLSYGKVAASLGLPGLPEPVTGPYVAAAIPPLVAAPETQPLVTRPTRTPPGPPGILTQAALVDAPDIGSNLRLGGFSGLWALDRSGTLFMVVTDRGPNDELGSGKDRKLTFPDPTFSPSLLKVQVVDGQIQILERIPLKLSGGYVDDVTGSDLVSGLSTSERDDEPWSKQARDRLPFDPNGVDTEGLAFDKRDGTYWLCEEYGPSILHVGADGTILTRLVPRGVDFDSPGEDVRRILPEQLSKRKANRGFEGLSISPDGSTIFAIMQSPLSNPDENAGENSRNIRLITLDVTNSANPRVSGMYLYLAESGSSVGTDQDDVKIGDLAALSNTRALVVERDNTEGGPHKMVYAIDLAGATNLLNHNVRSKKTIEEMRLSELNGARVRPVKKTDVADLAQYGFSPEKLEGLAVVDERTIAVSNDNDFGFAGFDENDQAIPSGRESQIVLIRLERALR